MKYFFIPALSLSLILTQLSIIQLNLVLIIFVYWFVWKNEINSIVFMLTSSFFIDLLTDIPLGTSLIGFLFILAAVTYFKKVGFTRRKIFVVGFMFASLIVWEKIVGLVIISTR